MRHISDNEVKEITYQRRTESGDEETRRFSDFAAGVGETLEC